MNPETEARRRSLQRELEAIEEGEHDAAEARRREAHFQNFLKRPSDIVVGRAHCDPRFTSNGYAKKDGEPFNEFAIHIEGNCGMTYFPVAGVTSATKMYFHNCWPQIRQDSFANKLNKLIEDEIRDICSEPRLVIEMLGLQSDAYHLGADFPESRVPEMRQMIDEARAEVLDKFTDEQLLEAARSGPSHGASILRKFVEANRPHLLAAFENASNHRWSAESASV